jgi:transcriptional regulator with XRE-family HTH domain
MAQHTELGAAVRAWRERLSPTEVNLPTGARRRVSGLRREELALMAGISVDYLVRIEQGRSSRPSGQVLGALARALRLDPGERELLYRAAGIAPPSWGEVPRAVPAAIRLMIDRMADSPVAVFSAAWDMVECNRLWQELFGATVAEQDPARNLIWWHFAASADRSGRASSESTVVRDPDQADAFEREIVSDLRRAADRYPDDRAVAELISALYDENPRFAELWSRYEVAAHSAGRKTVVHPELGPVAFDGNVLSVEGADLRIVICSARPGTPDAEAFELLYRRTLESPLGR